MIVLFICFILLCIKGIQIGRKNAYDSYLSRQRTDSVKGIFILLVFFSHIKTYIEGAGYVYTPIENAVFRHFFSYLGQLVVVMFLFYSGFGVMERIQRNGAPYIKAMPKHRVLTTLLNFDIAVCLFLLMDFVLGCDFSLQQFLLSLLAWDSMGNSNWYILAILICYILTWVLANFFHRPSHLVAGMFTFLAVVIVILSFVKESWWYNTLWAYPAGMFFSVHKQQIEALTDHHYAVVLTILFLLFAASWTIPFEARGFRTNLLSVLFSFIIVVLTMRIRIRNTVIQWCGQQLFPIYIYQRMPMIVLMTLLPTWMLNEHPWIYVSLCLSITIVIAWAHKFFKISL